MNRQEAKQILALYRPGTADETDPSFDEARRLCGSDAELREWFEQHCAVYQLLRSKFRQTPIPEGLKEQILAERKVHLAPSWRRRPALLAAAAALVGMAMLWVFLNRPAAPREDVTYAGFLPRMVGTALRAYNMDIGTADPDAVRNYLRLQQMPIDYAIPESLSKNARLLGCAIVPWQQQKLTMICYRSGRPLPPGQGNDLWLFVYRPGEIAGSPDSAAPVIQKVNRTTTATWTANGNTYLLVADGDEQFLRKYL
ncbi:MAG: hypothetical protein U1F98_10415 [Verrucomicrobiota bacterium]